MIAAILRRELVDHLTSLRFALTLLITTALMAVNGVVFSGGVRAWSGPWSSTRRS